MEANTHVIRASHSKKFSSLIGPATIPSGGFNVSSAQQHNTTKRLLTKYVTIPSVSVLFVYLTGQMSLSNLYVHAYD